MVIWPLATTEMTDTVHESVTEDASVATGANGTRDWPRVVKARSVAKTFEEVTAVAGVARRHGPLWTQINEGRCMAQDQIFSPAAGASVRAVPQRRRAELTSRSLSDLKQ